MKRQAYKHHAAFLADDSYVIKLRDENYYLAEGPTGYAFARSKARAKRFPTERDARAFAKVVAGNLTVVELSSEPFEPPHVKSVRAQQKKGVKK